MYIYLYIYINIYIYNIYIYTYILVAWPGHRGEKNEIKLKEIPLKAPILRFREMV